MCLSRRKQQTPSRKIHATIQVGVQEIPVGNLKTSGGDSETVSLHSSFALILGQGWHWLLNSAPDVVGKVPVQRIPHKIPRLARLHPSVPRFVRGPEHLSRLPRPCNCLEKTHNIPRRVRACPYPSKPHDYDSLKRFCLLREN